MPGQVWIKVDELKGRGRPGPGPGELNLQSGVSVVCNLRQYQARLRHKEVVR